MVNDRLWVHCSGRRVGISELIDSEIRPRNLMEDNDLTGNLTEDWTGCLTEDWTGVIT